LREIIKKHAEKNYNQWWKSKNEVEVQWWKYWFRVVIKTMEKILWISIPNSSRNIYSYKKNHSNNPILILIIKLYPFIVHEIFYFGIIKFLTLINNTTTIYFPLFSPFKKNWKNYVKIWFFKNWIFKDSTP